MLIALCLQTLNIFPWCPKRGCELTAWSCSTQHGTQLLCLQTHTGPHMASRQWPLIPTQADIKTNQKDTALLIYECPWVPNDHWYNQVPTLQMKNTICNLLMTQWWNSCKTGPTLRGMQIWGQLKPHPHANPCPLNVNLVLGLYKVQIQQEKWSWFGRRLDEVGYMSNDCSPIRQLATHSSEPISMNTQHMYRPALSKPQALTVRACSRARPQPKRGADRKTEAPTLEGTQLLLPSPPSGPRCSRRQCPSIRPLAPHLWHLPPPQTKEALIPREKCKGHILI